MARLTAALVSALCEGADISTISTLNASQRDFHQVVGLDVCARLTRLDLSGNKLTSLEGISLCTSLKWLSVAENSLKSLKGVESLTHITVLNASRNEITSMAEVTGLVELRALILNNNAISTVVRLDQLKNLSTLVLSHNPIRDLGKAANMLASLTKLSLSYCRIQLLGASLRRCVALQELRLASNNMSVLPKELERNGHLRILDLGKNEIRRWADLQVLNSFSDLKVLNLRGNPICLEDNYIEKVTQLAPRLQTLDGRPLGSYQKGAQLTIQANEGALKLPSASKVVKEQVTQIKPKKRKLKDATEGTAVSMALETEDKPFLDLITESSKVSVRDSFHEDAEIPGTSSIQPEDSGKATHEVPAKKRLISRVLHSLGEVEIGLGGPSTWEVAIEPTVFEEKAQVVNPQPAYTRWKLKK